MNMPIYFTRIFIILISLMLVSLPSYAVEVRLAVASNFRVTLDSLVKAYQDKYDGEFSISSASTGVLYAQIKQGAPFDLFFSADKQTAQKISKIIKGRYPPQKAASPFTYAHGLLTFWCANNEALTSTESLTSNKVNTKVTPKSITELKAWRGRYAIANPKLAPYGKAAKAVIKELHWPNKSNATGTGTGTVSNIEVMGNNVSQVAQFILTKNVDCGFVAKSLLTKEANDKQVFILPTETYSPIIQQALILPYAYKQKEKSARVRHFVEYIQEEARVLIAESGYGLPSDNYYVSNRVNVSNNVTGIAK